MRRLGTVDEFDKPVDQLREALDEEMDRLQDAPSLWNAYNAATRLYSEVMPSSRTLAAPVTAGAGSSLVATQGIPGFEPSAFQTLGPPAIRSAKQAATAFSEFYEPQLASILTDLNQDFARQLQVQANDLARIPFQQISELVDGQFFQQVAEIARQFEGLQVGGGGLTAMGTVATPSGAGQDVLSHPSPSSPVQRPAEPTIGPQDAYNLTTFLVDTMLQPTVELPSLRERVVAVNRRTVTGVAACILPFLVRIVFLNYNISTRSRRSR